MDRYTKKITVDPKYAIILFSHNSRNLDFTHTRNVAQSTLLTQLHHPEMTKHLNAKARNALQIP